MIAGLSLACRLSSRAAHCFNTARYGKTDVKKTWAGWKKPTGPGWDPPPAIRLGKRAAGSGASANTWILHSLSQRGLR